jgi:hypothetical protein
VFFTCKFTPPAAHFKKATFFMGLDEFLVTQELLRIFIGSSLSIWLGGWFFKVLKLAVLSVIIFIRRIWFNLLVLFHCWRRMRRVILSYGHPYYFLLSRSSLSQWPLLLFSKDIINKGIGGHHRSLCESWGGRIMLLLVEEGQIIAIVDDSEGLVIVKRQGG